jgi:hypothetical protein
MLRAGLPQNSTDDSCDPGTKARPGEFFSASPGSHAHLGEPFWMKQEFLDSRCQIDRPPWLDQKSF